MFPSSSSEDMSEVGRVLRADKHVWDEIMIKYKVNTEDVTVVA